MKPFNEDDLIAYHLHELSPRRARALEEALKADPSLAAESQEYALLLSSFKEGPVVDVDEEMLDRNWRELERGLPIYSRRPALSSRWLIPALTGVGVALAATTVMVTSHRHAAVPSIAAERRIRYGLKPPPIPNPSELTANPNVDQQGSNALKGSLGSQRSVAPPVLFRGERSRMIASAPNDDAPILHLIPLARVPIPTLSAPDQPLMTATPVRPLEIENWSQNPKPKQQRARTPRDHAMDITLAIGGTFIGTQGSSSNGATLSQGATRAVSANASFHQQFRPAIGYRAEVSFTHPDFVYGYRNSSNAGFQVNMERRIYEVSGTYVIQGPHRGALSTSAEAGGGLMTFLPSSNSSDTRSSVRGAGIVGVSAEFDLTKHLAVHTGYRLRVFKGPDLESDGTFSAIPVTSTTLFSNEPVMGITYRFTRK